MDKTRPVTDRTKPVTDSSQDCSPVRRTAQRGGQQRGRQGLPWRRPSIRKLGATERTRSGPRLHSYPTETVYYTPSKLTLAKEGFRWRFSGFTGASTRARVSSEIEKSQRAHHRAAARIAARVLGVQDCYQVR